MGCLVIKTQIWVLMTKLVARALEPPAASNFAGLILCFGTVIGPILLLLDFQFVRY